jgi:predicted nucleic acid-binding protein
MRVVSNTSPISNLAMVGRLRFLREQMQIVLIPKAVFLELQRL